MLKNITNNVKNAMGYLNVSRATVLGMKAKLKLGDSAARKRGSGRKLVLSGVDRRKIGLIAQLNPQLSNQRISSKLKQLGYPSVTNRTVGNYLARLGIT